MKLPTLNVYFDSYELVKDPETGEFEWQGRDVEVEVVTLHLRTGKMRLRTKGKHPKFGDGQPETLSFDAPIDPFFKKYQIIERLDDGKRDVHPET